MKKFKWIVGFSALWLVVLSVLCAVYALRVVPQSEYTAESDTLWRGDDLYASDNARGFGVLYRIKPNQSVDRLFRKRLAPFISKLRLERIAVSSTDDTGEEGIYALAEKRSSDVNPRMYRIVRFTAALSEEAVTKAFYFDDQVIVTGFSVNDEDILVTTITAEKDQALVYRIPKQELIPMDEARGSRKEELGARPEPLDADSSETVSGGALLVEALYADDSLNTRTERQAPAGVFSEDEEARLLFNSRQLSPVQKFLVSGLSRIVFLLVFGAGVLILAFLFNILTGKRRIVYRILEFEALLFILISTVFTAITLESKKEHDRNFADACEIAMGILSQGVDLNDIPGVYGSGDYQQMVADMYRVTQMADDINTIRDISFYNTQTGEILADSLVFTRKNMNFVYGEDPDRLAGQIIEQPALGNENVNAIALVAPASAFEYIFFHRPWIPFTGALIFLTFSFLGCWSLVREGRDVRQLGRALGLLAEGDYSFQKPEHVLGWDLVRMWNSVNEIRRSIKSINYKQFMIYKAYYRFAPKNIERILKKDTITDVRSGDAIRLTGTQVLVRTERQRDDNPDEMRVRNEFLEVVERVLSSEDGIFISSDSDLSMTRILFLEESHGCVRFGVNLLQDIRGIHPGVHMPPTTVLMHHAPFVYGVAGTSEQASAFLSSPETERLEGYLDWFHRMHLGVLVTEIVVRAEEGLGDLR
ncbi:MAG: hypothetical protein IJV04_10575, partial [Lachnospiraceae bacterium]|nr:hypothetical protein [Lachnospiraceae bacterium]